MLSETVSPPVRAEQQDPHQLLQYFCGVCGLPIDPGDPRFIMLFHKDFEAEVHAHHDCMEFVTLP